MRPLTRKALSDLTRRKLRTLLIVLGIAIGVMGLATTTIAASQFQSSLSYSVDATSQPDLTFKTVPADIRLASTLAQQANVNRVEARGIELARWAVSTGHVPFDLEGIPAFSAVQINTFALVEGHLPGPHQIVLEASDQGVQHIRIGDQITLEVGGNAQVLTVAGFARTRGQLAASFTGQGTGYMRETDLQALFQLPGVNEFFVRLNNYGQRAATARSLATVFAANQVEILSTTVGRTSIGGGELVTGILAVMSLLALIALLLSVFLLLSTMVTLLAEQVPMIGTMKAIGGSRRKIMSSYLLAVGVASVLGTLLGLLLGVPGGALLTSYFNQQLTLDTSGPLLTPTLFVLSVIAGIVVPLAVAVLPIFLGTRLTVRQALSGYGLDTATLRRSKRSGSRLLNFLPQTVLLGMHNLWRKRTRTLLTLLALVFSGIAFLAVQATAFSVNTYLEQVSSTYHASIFVYLPDAAASGPAQAVIQTVPGVSRIERLARVNVQTSWGQGLLTGLEPGTQLYHKQLVTGRWFNANDHDAVILSADAAAKSGLTVGKSIHFYDDLHSATWHIIGIVTDENGLGANALGAMLAPINQVNAFEQPPNNLNAMLMVEANNTAQPAVNALASQIDAALSHTNYASAVETRQQLDQQNQSLVLILSVLLNVVVGVVALVGTMGLFNTLVMNVLEQRREIGILRSMGATGRKVAQVFWTEGMALGLVAWLIATLLGVPAAYGFVRVLGALVLPVPFAFDLGSPGWMLVAILILASLASVGPALRAARLRITNTLRYE